MSRGVHNILWFLPGFANFRWNTDGDQGMIQTLEFWMDVALKMLWKQGYGSNGWNVEEEIDDSGLA